MAEIINLRSFRKQKARAEAQAVLLGRSKAERRLTDAERDKAGRQLDGHRLERDDDDPEPA